MNKEIKVPISSIKDWTFDLAKDDPGISDFNAARYAVFKNVLHAWMSLNAELLNECFTSNFEYGSFWVMNTMIGADTYLDYITAKFKTILSSGKRPAVTQVLLHTGKSAVDYTYAIHLIQGGVGCLLLFSFDGEKICKLYMTNSQLYQFVPCTDPVMNTNHEPAIFKAPKKLFCHGKMKPEDFDDFAIRSYAGMFNEGQVHVKKIISTPEKNCPHIVLERQGKIFFLFCDIFLPPFSEGHTHLSELQDFISYSHQQGAEPALVTLGMFCFDTNGKEAVYGGNFAMKHSPIFFL